MGLLPREGGRHRPLPRRTAPPMYTKAVRKVKPKDDAFGQQNGRRSPKGAKPSLAPARWRVGHAFATVLAFVGLLAFLDIVAVNTGYVGLRESRSNDATIRDLFREDEGSLLIGDPAADDGAVEDIFSVPAPRAVRSPSASKVTASPSPSSGDDGARDREHERQRDREQRHRERAEARRASRAARAAGQGHGGSVGNDEGDTDDDDGGAVSPPSSSSAGGGPSDRRLERNFDTLWSKLRHQRVVLSKQRAQSSSRLTCGGSKTVIWRTFKNLRDSFVDKSKLWRVLPERSTGLIGLAHEVKASPCFKRHRCVASHNQHHEMPFFRFSAPSFTHTHTHLTWLSPLSFSFTPCVRFVFGFGWQVQDGQLHIRATGVAARAGSRAG